MNAQLLVEHLRKRTTLQLCEDYTAMSQGDVEWHKIAARMISDVLFERDQMSWFEWQLDGSGLFGPADPARFFMP
ncbi:hypothetical protein [Streptomyces graminilatus]|uniref:hypothetical protein n=1 Tax=Streptomyces graminilatus TaxID=1464070 RepID=UPI0012FEB054|nr:hypothetical protein [Streptomyces graminilatus]